MSLHEQEIRLGDAYDDLDRELDTLVETFSDADPDTASAATLEEMLNQTERALSGVAYLIHGDDDVEFDGYGSDETVVIGGLDAGDYARIEDRAAAIAEQSDEPGGHPGSRSNVYAAMALVEAPFIPDDAEGDPLDVRMAAIASQPVGVRDWIQSRANDLTTVGEGNFRGWRERLAEQQAEDQGQEA